MGFNGHVKILTIFFMIITICIASGCGGGGGGGGGGSTVSAASVSGEEEKSEPISFDYTVTGPVKEKGDRLLGVMPYPSENGDDSRAFNIARSAGINAVLIGYSWPEVEAEAGVSDFTEIDKHNSIYASKDIKVTLMLNPIETDWISVPSDLKNVPFDDPEMIGRFKMFLSNVFDHFPDLNIETLLIGNEVNGYLYNHDQWNEYKAFYEAVGSHARTLRPGIKIGTEMMFEGIINIYPEKVKALTASSDVFAITYYPSDPKKVYHPSIDVMGKDIADLTSTYPEKKIYIIETGYSSSPALQSSEGEQAEFIGEAFKIWDEHADQIEFVSFFMLHDYSKEYIENLYGVLDVDKYPNYGDLLEALTTMGLRTFAGKGRDKFGFYVLVKEAKARGW